MNKLIYKFFLLSVAGIVVLTIGCQKAEIPLYSSEESAVRFPGIGGVNGDTLFRNYSNGLFTLWYSFLSDPFVDYKDIEVPVIYMGLPSEKEITVNVAIVPNENNASSDQYEMQRASIPAGKLKGAIIIRVKNAAALDSTTRQLHLTINASNDYKCGPVEYLNAVLYWNNEITPPTATNDIRSYNMLIAGNANFIATTLTHYSPRAHKVILAATGWEVLPSYTTIYNGNLYFGYAKQIAEYIATYNAAHPSEPLVHDAGTNIGLPIEARTY